MRTTAMTTKGAVTSRTRMTGDACFGGAAAYVLYTNPTDGNADSVPTCLVKLTTGFDCPGCGGTRAFYYALHGNLPAAARHR